LILLQVHRLVVVDNEDRVIGVISLSDILSELVLKPSRKLHILINLELVI
jgi:5'-AMP-activated protein kinase regulatory gamma subunit